MMCMCIYMYVHIVANFPFWLAYLDDPSWQSFIVITHVNLHVSLPGIYSYFFSSGELPLSFPEICFPYTVLSYCTLCTKYMHTEVLTHAYIQIYTLSQSPIRTYTPKHIIYTLALAYNIHVLYVMHSQSHLHEHMLTQSLFTLMHTHTHTHTHTPLHT